MGIASLIELIECDFLASKWIVMLGKDFLTESSQFLGVERD